MGLDDVYRHIPEAPAQNSTEQEAVTRLIDRRCDVKTALELRLMLGIREAS
jgi:hypothetical protein